MASPNSQPLLGVRSLLSTLLVVGACLAGLATAYSRGWLRFNDPSERDHPVLGIDVSHHQGVVDWRPLPAAGVRFAFIKSSEGETLKDLRFAANAAAAAAAGIAWGPYHFFTFCTPGASQARNFRATAASLPRDLPPVVDIEFVGNCRSWTSLSDVRRELTIFLERVEADFGEPAILYVTREAEERLLAGAFPGFARWPRSVLGRPSPDTWSEWTFWQFADNGRLPGISGPVDLDVYCCSEAEFLARKW